jgi:pSer/pThr/pTyr-binding forkhead associated (FHA) protein
MGHGVGRSTPEVGSRSTLWDRNDRYGARVPENPLDPHLATPTELQERIHAERRGTPFLVFRTDENAQVIVDLGGDQARLTIGRRPTNDVVLEWDQQVSRVHAELERIGEDWVISDDGLSHNGTYVNGDRVTGQCRLADGDTIAIGSTAIVFRAPTGASQSMPTMTAAGFNPGANITPAQRRVLVALCRPFKDSAYAAPASNQQVADELVISVETVKSTLRALFEAFGVDDLPQNQKRATLALRALQSGAVSRRDL